MTECLPITRGLTLRTRPAPRPARRKVPAADTGRRQQANLSTWSPPRSGPVHRRPRRRRRTLMDVAIDTYLDHSGPPTGPEGCYIPAPVDVRV